MLDIKKSIAEYMESLELGLDQEVIYDKMETPPNPELGDYAFPCFLLAKKFRKAPQAIAADLAEQFDCPLVEKVQAVGPYLNLFLSKSGFAKTTLEEILEQGEKYGSEERGDKKTIVIDYSSTNIAKPFHIGHIRSTVIGDSLKRIHKFLGYPTVGVNYLGDYGTQFGMLINAYRMWGDKEALEKDPIRELLKLYVRYNEEADKDETLREEARYWFKQLEDGNEEAREIWTWFKKISLQEFMRVYDMLGISFDSFNGEAFHSQFVPQVIEELEEKGLLEESEGAMIVDLSEFDIPPAIIKKSDGSSTYITRDLATALYRKRTYDFEDNIYVVATQQNLHFIQLREVLKKMGYEWYDHCKHVPFGMISLESGTLSTREGKVVFLEDVLNQSIEKTREIIEERNPDLENKEEISKMVGIGAVKFQELFNNRIKDYVFRWDEVLNFDGETGPYVQYTHARANSVLEKSGEEVTGQVDFSRYQTREEINVIRALYDFPAVVRTAKEKLEPSIITRQIVEIAKTFNKFYNTCPILSAEEEDRKARLLLTYATKTVIKIGLNLLGIEAPNKM